MRIALGFASLTVAVGVAACTPQYKKETLGEHATNAPVQLAAGMYDLDLRFDLPRAEVVAWKVECPGVSKSGTVGESAEAYRTRRIAEVTQQEKARREREAAVANLAFGAAKAPVKAQANLDIRVELAPGDVGGGRVTASTEVQTDAPGACTVTATTEDDAPVQGVFAVTHVRDMWAEQHAKDAAVREQAVVVRTGVRESLVAVGADETWKERRETAARVKHDQEKELRLERERAVEMERARTREIAETARVRVRTRAYEVRDWYVEWLITWCGADGGRRARIAAERERREGQRRLQIQLEEARRLSIAIDIRVRMRGWLVAEGAVERPPMPGLVAEDHATPPFDGAVWTSGAWTWNHREWVWTKGSWSDPTHFGGSGVSDPTPTVTATAVVTPPPPPVVTTTVVVTPPPPTATVVVTPPPPPPTNTVIVVRPKVIVVPPPPPPRKVKHPVHR